jgi:predicted secreted protein
MKRDHNKEAEKYRRKQMMQAFNKAYAALRADPAAWQEL